MELGRTPLVAVGWSPGTADELRAQEKDLEAPLVAGAPLPAEGSCCQYCGGRGVPGALACAPVAGPTDPWLLRPLWFL